MKAETALWPCKKVQKCTIAGITAGCCPVAITAVVTEVPAVDDKKGWNSSNQSGEECGWKL